MIFKLICSTPRIIESTYIQKYIVAPELHEIIYGYGNETVILLNQLLRIMEENVTTTDPSHDIDHHLRVFSNVLYIMQVEGGDIEIAMAAALLHDMVNLPKDHPKSAQASVLTAKKVGVLLTVEAEFPIEKITPVKTAIIQHSFSRGDTPSTLEAKIIQDADRLDSLGTIAIFRVIATMGQMKGRFYHRQDPFGENRDLQPMDYALDFILDRVMVLENYMHTTIGKQWGRERTRDLKPFLDRLKMELFLGKPDGYKDLVPE